MIRKDKNKHTAWSVIQNAEIENEGLNVSSW